MADGPSCPRLPFSIKNGRFVADKKLGAGCFASVCSGNDTQRRQPIAVKLEDSRSRQLQLEQEFQNLTKITAGERHPQGFVEVYYFGKEKTFFCLCMELLGPTLEDKLQQCGGTFTVRTALVIAEQVVRRLEYLHSRGIVHRDIKPENFTFGHHDGDKRHHVYLIDFGLSKAYFEGQHTREVCSKRLTGTARYASINAHRGVEQSRRDDLEAVGHMLIYFVRGKLPWSGINAKSRDEKYRKIMEKKQSFSLTELCTSYPDAFRTYLETCRNMGFRERPDYVALRALFFDARASVNNPGDTDLQWLDGQPLPNSLIPLEDWRPPMQPDDYASSTTPLGNSSSAEARQGLLSHGIGGEPPSCASGCLSWVRGGRGSKASRGEP